MADRLLVPYKSSSIRIFETIAILVLSFGLAEVSQSLLPGLSVSYAIVIGLIVGYTLVPRIGDRWAIRRGAQLMSRDERSQRYLGELGPIGTADTSASLLVSTQQIRLRRTGSRPRHRSRRLR